MTRSVRKRLREELPVLARVIAIEAALLAIPFGAHFSDVASGGALLSGHWFLTWGLLRFPYIPMAILALWYAIRLSWILLPPEE